MRGLASLSLAIPAALVLAACASTAAEPAPPDEPMRITIIPSLTSIDGGATIRLTLTARQADGTILHPVAAVWRSSDLTVATVGQGGLVRGGSPGTAEITARWHGAGGTALVKVLPTIKPKNDPLCQEALRIPGSAGEPGTSECRL